MRLISKTKQLVELREKYPDWSYRQYAEYLDTSHETVRSLLSRLGLSRKKKGRPSNEERDHAAVKRKKKKLVMPESPQHRVFSKAGPRSYGYTKLI